MKEKKGGEKKGRRKGEGKRGIKTTIK